MSEQDNGKVAVQQRPTTVDRTEWKVYWEQQGQSWRTEPEIDIERQKYLAGRRAVVPDIEKGIYPFKGMKLNRADIEWLLATHENGRGPVDWNDESQWEREGLDLRGTDLSQVDLNHLPLACLQGTLNWEERASATEEQTNVAAVCMQKANLVGARLQEAKLWGAQLQKANLMYARLQGTLLGEAQLREADLKGAQLKRANLWGAQLQGASLWRALLHEAHLVGAQLQGADLRETNLEHGRLNHVMLSDQTYGSARLADINWGEVNLAVVDWAHLPTLGDEQVADQKKDSQGKTKDKQTRIYEYKEAVRAYRQLSVVLRNQGLNEDAARFAYRAQLLQRVVFRQQSKIGQYLFSLFLDLLAGYGYKVWRSFVAYLLVITAFAITYFIIGHTVGPVLSPLGAFVFSMTSFHGRGFFPGGIALDDPLTVFAAIEAFVGLLIEVTFIATLTQRLFGK